MPLKRRNIVLGFFEISLECFQPVLLLWVGVVCEPPVATLPTLD